MNTPQSRLQRPRPPGSIRRPSSRSTDSLKQAVDVGVAPPSASFPLDRKLPAPISRLSFASSSSGSSTQSLYSSSAGLAQDPDTPLAHRRRLARISASPASRAPSAERELAHAAGGTASSDAKSVLAQPPRSPSPAQPSPPPPYGHEIPDPLAMADDAAALVSQQLSTLLPTLSTTLLLASPPDAKSASARRARSHPRPVRPADLYAVQAEADERIAQLESLLADARSSEDAQRKAAARLRRDLDKVRREFDRYEARRSVSPEKQWARAALARQLKRESEMSRAEVEQELDADSDVTEQAALVVTADVGDEREGEDDEDEDEHEAEEDQSEWNAEEEDERDTSVDCVDNAIAFALDPVALAYDSLTRRSTSTRARPSLPFRTASDQHSVALRRKSHVSIAPIHARLSSGTPRSLPHSPYPPRSDPSSLSARLRFLHQPSALSMPETEPVDDADDAGAGAGVSPTSSASPFGTTSRRRGTRSPSPLSALAQKMESMRSYVEHNLRSLGSELALGQADENGTSGESDVEDPKWGGGSGRMHRHRRRLDAKENDEGIEDAAYDNDGAGLDSGRGPEDDEDDADDNDALAPLALADVDDDTEETETETDDDDAQRTPTPIPAVVSAALSTLALHLGPRADAHALGPSPTKARVAVAARMAKARSVPVPVAGTAWWDAREIQLGEPMAASLSHSGASPADSDAGVLPDTAVAAAIDADVDPARPELGRRNSQLRPLILPARNNSLSHVPRASAARSPRSSLSTELAIAALAHGAPRRPGPVRRSPSGESALTARTVSASASAVVGSARRDEPSAITHAPAATPPRRARYKPREMRTVPGRAVHDLICWALFALDWSEWALLCLYRLYLDLRRGPRRPFGVRRFQRYYS
ncbi:hypothetical protein Q5752_000464 [Cryptotrichosporon argae]